MKKIFKFYTLELIIGAIIGLGVIQFGFLGGYWLDIFGSTMASFSSQTQTDPAITSTPTTPPVSREQYHPTQLLIPSAGIDLPVVSVPLLNGTWKVQERVANYAEGTSLINSESGNVGLFSHDRPYTFAKIKDLKIGDQVMIKTAEGYQATYLVNQSYQVNPKKVSVFYPTAKPTLTLVTCDGIFSNLRYVVKAKLDRIDKM